MTSPNTPSPGQSDPAALLALGLATQTGFEAGASSPAPPSPAELAAEFPQLEIIELLGRGGMGAVYKARQRDLDRLVALKILRPGLDADPGFAERFTREARALAQLNHPGIVTLYEFGRTSAGRYFILMEFVDGVNLRQLLAAGRLAPREALAIVPPLCDALQYAHDRGLIHRDIKPENILIDRLGRVKIADFGIAKLAATTTGEKGAGHSSLVIGHSVESGVMGTPAYMAPEQRDHPAEVDHRADLYALGVVFYQMLTGELPAAGQLQPPSHRVQLDIRLDEIVLRALEKDPARRYAAASEFKTQVETVAQGPASAPVPFTQRLRRVPPWVLLCAVTAIILIFSNTALTGLKSHQAGSLPTNLFRRILSGGDAGATRPAAPTPRYKFGETIELTLSRKRPGAYDLDRARFVDYKPAPAEPHGLEASPNWHAKNGTDLFADPSSHTPGVLFMGTDLIEVEPAVWTASADTAAGVSRKSSDGLMTFVAAPDFGEPPATRVYRSAQGGVMLVQLLRTTDAGDVVLRYKPIVPVALPATTAAPSPTPNPLDPAVREARAWLRLLDEGRYAQSWLDTSALFRSAIPENRWLAVMKSMRTHLGVPTSRQLVRTRETPRFPDLPDGLYLVLEFETAFSSGQLTDEDVVLVHEPTGDWRVARSTLGNVNEEDKTVRAAARAWLEAIDAGRLETSWDKTSAWFQAAVTREQWVSDLRSARTPLGPLQLRLIDASASRTMTRLPGGPDGYYYVMKFITVFTHQPAAIETVTFIREPDGQWRACGYLVLDQNPPQPDRGVRVNVIGAVNRPGSWVLPANPTLLDALAAASGWTAAADIKKVSILPPSTSTTPAALAHHDVSAILKGQAPNPTIPAQATVILNERIY